MRELEVVMAAAATEGATAAKVKVAEVLAAATVAAAKVVATVAAAMGVVEKVVATAAKVAVAAMGESAEVVAFAQTQGSWRSCFPWPN